MVRRESEQSGSWRITSTATPSPRSRVAFLRPIAAAPAAPIGRRRRRAGERVG